MLGVFIIFTLLAAAIYRLCRHYTVLVDSVKNIPCQKSVPLIGDMNMIKNRYDIISYLYGVSTKIPFYRTWVGPKLLLIITDAQVIKQILTAPQLLNKPSLFYEVMRLPKGLICSHYNLWRVHRKIINPSFNPKILQNFIPIFQGKAQKLTESLAPNVDTGIEFDVLDNVMQCTMDTVFATTLGTDGLTEATTKKIIKLLHTLADFVEKRMFHPKLMFHLIYKFTQPYRDEERIRYDMTVIVNPLLEHRKAVYQNTKSLDLQTDDSFKPQIFIDQLISKGMDDNAGAHLENEEILEECYSTMAAGSETTALTVSYAIVLLAMHPEIQAMAVKEVDEFFANNDTITAESLNSLVFMETVVKETLRLMPPVPLIAREPMADLDLGVCTLKPSMVVGINIFALHRNENLWGKDANEFRPDRFNAANADKIVPYSYIPFSSGPRNCVGTRYANMSIKILLLNLLKSYKFSTTLKLHELKFGFTISLILRNKHLVSIERR